MRSRAFLFATLALAPAALAQNVFLAVEEGSSPRMVKRVSFNRPQVEVDGKLQGTTAPRYALTKATLYRPGLVTITSFRVVVSHVEFTSGGGGFNYEIHLYGHLNSDTALQSCFIVLELNSWNDAGCVFAELPDLSAGKTVDLDQVFQLPTKLDEGKYRVHLFANGIEVLHSKMPTAYLAAQKKKTEYLLSGKGQDYAPILAQSTTPAYPASLKAERVPGSARVRCHIKANGEVESVELVSATNAAFGEAALAAVPRWKFDPALKARHFVDAIVEIPVEFKPPR